MLVETHLDDRLQRAKESNPKCQIDTLDCTLEEIAVMQYLKENPTATQKEIAGRIGKSERTVKRITANLSSRELIERKAGRRNGFWVVKGLN